MSKQINRVGIWACMLLLTAAAGFPRRAQAEDHPAATPSAARLKTIYRFKGTNGSSPESGLVEFQGNYYGTTWTGGKHNRGTVFQLSPPAAAGGPWTHKVLHSFHGGDNDGADPLGDSLLVDGNGVLYGMAQGGGPNRSGAVFQVTPPSTAGGAWTETMIYAFPDGGDLVGGLIMDGAGNLYGTATVSGIGDGTVFELSPPKAAGGVWNETTLHTFRGADGNQPSGFLLMDSSGALYGTTFFGGYTKGSICAKWGCGTVYQLVPPATAGDAWTEHVLYAFKARKDGANPVAGLIMDGNGVLYGTGTTGGKDACDGGFVTPGCGVVFSLTPPATAGGKWTETTLHVFTGSPDGAIPYYGSLTMDSNGALYGATTGGGTKTSSSAPNGGGIIFKLTPPASAGGAWKKSTIYNFSGGATGGRPNADMLLSNGTLYGTTGSGGTDCAPSGCGTVFELTIP